MTLTTRKDKLIAEALEELDDDLFKYRRHAIGSSTMRSRIKKHLAKAWDEAEKHKEYELKQNE